MREWPIDERPVPGNWWIPDNPGRRVPGVLERRPAGHGVLRLNDVLLEPPGNDFWRLRSEPIPLILGDTGGLRTVSLINCFEFDRSSPLSRAPGPKSQTFGVQYSLITSIIGGENDPSASQNPDPPVHSVWTRFITCELRIVGQDLVDRLPGSQLPQDRADGDTRATHAWQAPHTSRVDGDAFEGHGANVGPDEVAGRHDPISSDQWK